MLICWPLTFCCHGLITEVQAHVFNATLLLTGIISSLFLFETCKKKCFGQSKINFSSCGCPGTRPHQWFTPWWRPTGDFLLLTWWFQWWVEKAGPSWRRGYGRSSDRDLLKPPKAQVNTRQLLITFLTHQCKGTNPPHHGWCCSPIFRQ